MHGEQNVASQRIFTHLAVWGKKLNLIFGVPNDLQIRLALAAHLAFVTETRLTAHSARARIELPPRLHVRSLPLLLAGGWHAQHQAMALSRYMHGKPAASDWSCSNLCFTQPGAAIQA